MTPSEDEALKSVADAVVRTLASADARLALRVLGLGEAPRAEPSLVTTEPGWVGIWKQTGSSPAFERARERGGEWHLWADIPMIPAKGSRKRIVYIGESTARGYFYDPAFTPAAVLERMLGRAAIPEGVEIVDLARSDLAFEGDLVRLIESARALEPDAYVVFAGNNRKLPRALLKSPPSRPAMIAEVLRRAGVTGLCGLAAQWREREVETVVAALARLDVPVLVIVPEFNLGDWRNEASGDVPWLPGDANQRWFEARARAREALARDDLDAAEDHATRMLSLDHGTAGAGLEILAACRRRRGDHAGHKDYARRARDAHMGWDFDSPQTPRLDAVTRAALGRGLDAAGLAHVDCADVFDQHLDGQAPDRRVFLDYCHLTSDGIRMVMARAAQALLELLGAAPISTPTLLEAAPTPAPAVESQARFAAAIHNAHWGQEFAIVHHHCARAVELAPALAPVFEEYLIMATSRAPNWMCRSMDRLLHMLDMGCAGLIKYVLGYGAVSLLDVTLTNAIAAAIEPVRPGARARLEALRAREYGLVAGVREDLLAHQYAPSFMDREWAHSGVAGAVEANLRPVVSFVAHSPISQFTYVCEAPGPVLVELVWRLVDIDRVPAEVEIAVNGAVLLTASVTHDWSVVDVLVPSSDSVAGLNTITIRWPTALVPGQRGLERVAERIEHRRGVAHLMPVYGMIHSLTARQDRGQSDHG